MSGKVKVYVSIGATIVFLVAGALGYGDLRELVCKAPVERSE